MWVYVLLLIFIIIAIIAIIFNYKKKGSGKKIHILSSIELSKIKKKYTK